MRRFGSSPETRAIAPATLQSSATGAVLLASTFLIVWLFAPGGYRTDLMLATILMSLVFGFIAGGLGIGLALMIIGVPVARFAKDRLEGTEGMVLATLTAAICIAAFYAVSDSSEYFWALASACFALPAAFLYRRQILLERAFDRP